MTYPTLPSISASSITQLYFEPQIAEVSLGGSYRQRIRLGLGREAPKWDVTWDYLTIKDKKKMADFLQKMNGVDLFFFKPDSAEKAVLVYCASWQVKTIAGGYWHINARFHGAS